MSKVTELFQKISAIHARKERKENELTAARKAMKEAEEAMTAAVNADDMNAFAIASRAKEEAKQKINFLEMSLDVLPNTVTAAEAHAAWEDYIKEYNKNLAKKMDAYTKARRTLCSQFLELVTMQNDALKMRADLAQSVEEDTKVFEGMDFIPKRAVWDRAIRRASILACYDASLLLAQVTDSINKDPLRQDDVRNLDNALYNILDKQVPDKIDTVQ